MDGATFGCSTSTATYSIRAEFMGFYVRFKVRLDGVLERLFRFIVGFVYAIAVKPSTVFVHAFVMIMMLLRIMKCRGNFLFIPIDFFFCYVSDRIRITRAVTLIIIVIIRIYLLYLFKFCRRQQS